MCVCACVWEGGEREEEECHCCYGPLCFSSFSFSLCCQLLSQCTDLALSHVVDVVEVEEAQAARHPAGASAQEREENSGCESAGSLSGVTEEEGKEEERRGETRKCVCVCVCVCR